MITSIFSPFWKYFPKSVDLSLAFCYITVVTCLSSSNSQLEITASSNDQRSRNALAGQGGSWIPANTDSNPQLEVKLLREPDQLCEFSSFSMDVTNVDRIDTEIQYRESRDMMFNPPEGIVSVNCCFWFKFATGTFCNNYHMQLGMAETNQGKKIK